MIEFENYKHNIDFIDKPGISGVTDNKSVSYNGSINNIKKQKLQEDYVKPLLAAAIVGLNNTAAPLPTNTKFYDAWTDIDALELYLNTKPTCYLILGKPGAGAHSLGEAISKKLNCVHLCPKNIILDEMEQKSPTGICLDANMKDGKVCIFDILLKMLKIKLESPAVQHRGYVISGFPLVMCSRSPKYFINSLHGEEAQMAVDELLYDTICNLKKKKPKGHAKSSHTSVSSDQNIPGEEEVEEEAEPEEQLPEEEEELKVELPKCLLNTCSDIIHPKKAYFNTKKAVLLQQINELFNLNLQPDVVLYLSCPDKDLITKKFHKCFNYKNNQNTSQPLVGKAPMEIRWPVKYTTSDYTSPFDSHTFNPKYSCRHPMNFKHRATEQICNFKEDIFPFINNKLKDFKPKNVMKLDARLTLHEMMHNISERLLTLPILPVVIPEPLFMEEPSEDMEEFWKSVEELNVIHSGNIAFKRSPSLWFNRCPVELKKRLSMQGNPKLAVSFLKNVFLAASLDNMISFCRNPRPYLKIKFLEPTCRIIVIGTQLSGKTMISECLSWLFDAPIITYNSFLETERQKKYDTFAKTILSEIIATIEDARFAKWQNAEMERFANLDTWCNSTIATLKEYIRLLIAYNVLTQDIHEENKNEEDSASTIELLTSLHTFRNKLAFLPILDDVEQCEKALSNKVIVQYASADLRTPIVKPTLPMIGDEDVMESIAAYIIANELQKDIEPTTEELMEEIIRVITSLDMDSRNNTNFESMYGKYIIDGFPSDPEYWNILAEVKLLPDYVIGLIENREIEPEVITQYKDIGVPIKNHHERYTLANDPLIDIKIKTQGKLENSSLDVKIILNDFMTSFVEDEKAVVDSETEPWVSFAVNVDKFKEDWESVKVKIDEYNKCLIDVELENKTDVQVVEEVLLKLRKCYFISCEVSEDEEIEEIDDEIDEPKDIMTYNNPKSYGETNSYCPISYIDHGVLWEGKPELCVKFDNKLNYFCKEECSELYQKDVTKYQSYNKPFKTIPCLRICVIGCIGSGKTTVSKMLAKELGLMYIDFTEIINDLLIPKHFKKVGRRYENPFSYDAVDDEAVAEFQMDEESENLISQILSNETELRRMVFNYFERGAPLISPLMQRVITKLWLEEPYVSTGFILDGYPKLPTDIEDMTACFCIPDLVIKIEGNVESSLKRLSPKMFKTWKNQLSDAKERNRQKLNIERMQWMDFLTKNIVVKLIVDEVFDNMFFSAGEVREEISNQSVIIDAHPSGSVIDPNLFNTYNEMIQEFPEPIDQSEWEKPADAHERIDGRIESIYETDDENIEAVKDLLAEQRIKIVSVDGTKSLIKVIRVALIKLNKLRNRNESMFEQTIITNPDIAELLLLEGFLLLSKFNRMCPVYISENPYAKQSIYYIYKRKNKIYPIIHRSYVYFVCGEASVKKFRNNPLKYITSTNICQFIEYPLTIGVIGAPKSGKSSLSAKLAQRFGLLCLSKGIAVRDAIYHKPWTELATKMSAAASSGDCIDQDLVLTAVLNMTLDHRTITNGFVFDGFPETPAEAMDLVREGLYPSIVFDISANIEKVKESSQKELYYDHIKIRPTYSLSLIENRYRKWQDTKYKIREWINNDYQNMHVLDGNKSRWQCLQDAHEVINNLRPKVHYYLSNVERNIVPAHVMCISNNIFENRMSCLKNMCPICLQKNVLRHNSYPVDKKGVVQYLNKFYWICSEHMDTVLKNPDFYLTGQKFEIPEVPAIVKTVNMSLVYENGVCIVTYAENLPFQKILRGTKEYAASFRGNTYLFCNKACLNKFLEKPHMYYDISVFKETKFPSISLKKLPNLGYLEQSVGIVLTEACCSLNVVRPKYPGLNFQISGLLYIALYLKTHNPLIDKSALSKYKKTMKVFEARCKLITHVGLFLRSMENPFSNYPKCCGDWYKSCDSGTVRKPSSLASSSTRHSLSTSEAVSDI